MQRTPEAISAQPKSALFVSAILSGSAVLYQPGVVHTASPGDVLVYTPDVPYLIAFQPDTSQLFAELPLDVFEGRYGVSSAGLARKTNVGRSPASGFTVGDLQRRSRDVASPSAGDLGIHRQVDALLSLVAAQAYPATGHDAFPRARAFIDGNAADPDVTPTVVAAHVHLSVRQLNRLFSAEGTTVAAYLTSVRTAHAKRLLAEGLLPLSDIAAISGFGSVSTLSRHVRRRATAS